jgi:hypothetical protein
MLFLKIKANPLVYSFTHNPGNCKSFRIFQNNSNRLTLKILHDVFMHRLGYINYNLRRSKQRLSQIGQVINKMTSSGSSGSQKLIIIIADAELALEIQRTQMIERMNELYKEFIKSNEKMNKYRNKD